jgi:hypothetical protein
VGLVLCAEKGAAEAHYALEGLPNKAVAAEHQTILPDEKLLPEELAKTHPAHRRRWMMLWSIAMPGSKQDQPPRAGRRDSGGTRPICH